MFRTNAMPGLVMLLASARIAAQVAADPRVESCSDPTMLLQAQVKVGLESKLSPIYHGRPITNNTLDVTLSDAARVFDTAGLPYFAVYGSLIAMVRDGNFAAVNDDVDLAFNLDHKEQVVQAFKKAGFRVRSVPDCQNLPEWNYCREDLLLSHPNGGLLDLWGYYMSLDNSTVCVRTYMWSFLHDHVFPVQSMTAHRIVGSPQVAVPRNSEALLKQVYGNWRKPSGDHANASSYSAFTSVCGKGFQDRLPGKYAPPWKTDSNALLELPGQPQLVSIKAEVSHPTKDGSSFLQVNGSSFMQWIETGSSMNGYTAVGSASAVVALGLFFVMGGVVFPMLPKPLVNLFVIAIYCGLSLSIDMIIMYQKQTEGEGASVYKFDPVCSIILTESIKLFFSLTLYATDRLISGAQLWPAGLSPSDLKFMSMPAMLFTANNIMVFVAIAGNDVSAYSVFRDTMILWTALIWKCVFGSHLGTVRLVGIGVIFVGLFLNRSGHLSAATADWGFLLIVMMTVINATGCVCNEYALKVNKGLDINIQNSLLYGMCVTATIFILLLKSPAHLSSPSAFFQGFTNQTIVMVCLQVSAGLLVSRLLKYADAVYKTIGTCMRGPSLVLVAPFVLGSKRDPIAIVSAFIVAAGGIAYLTQGPLQRSGDAKANEAKNLSSGDATQTGNVP